MRRVTEEAHRDIPATVRLEEDLNALALLNEGDVAAAVNDAVRRVETTTQEKMSGLTAGLPLPPGFKLPF